MSQFLLYNIYIFICLILLSCDSNPSDSSQTNNCIDCELNIYDVYKQLDPLEFDTNGYYHYNYIESNASDYGTVYYTTSNTIIIKI